jgi:hypothetical protein
MVRQDLETAVPPGTRLRIRLIEVSTKSRNPVGSRVFHRAECPLPNGLLHLIQGARGPDPNRLRPLLGTAPDLRIDDGLLVMRWTDEPAQPQPYDAQQAIESVTRGRLSEFVVPHTGPLDVAGREELSRRLDSLVRLDKQDGGTQRPTWTATVAHPLRVSTEDVLAALVTMYPYRIRAANLRTDGTVQFNPARQAFLESERARRANRHPTSMMFRQGQYNYVDIGPGDSWDSFITRLNAYGLHLVDPAWIYEDRITLRSSHLL